jgi:hypothetical protein
MSGMKSLSEQLTEMGRDNTEITQLIHQLTKEIHDHYLGTSPAGRSAPAKPEDSARDS